MDDITRLTASELLTLYRNRQIAPSDVVAALLARIGARDPVVRAWQHIDGDHALAQAAALIPGPDSPLYGVPIGFKDIVDTADLPTTYGSPIYASHRPVKDAVCVSLSRAAGGIVLGKTVTTEFAGRNPGKTAHPLDPARTPGGSSSGSAAAVADGQVFLAIGSQTAGSTIRPAAYCGVYALKPSHGAISFSGMKHLSPRLDAIGLMGRSIADLALFRAALLGVSPVPYVPVSGPLCVGLCRTPYWSRASADVQAAIEQAATRLAASGIEIRQVTYPDAFGDAEELCWEVINFEAARELAWEYAQREHSLSPWARAAIENGRGISLDRHANNLQRLATAEQAFDTLFATVDVLIAPAAGEEAPMGLADTGSPIFNLAFQIAGLPAVSLPFRSGSAGLPIGLQLIGSRYRDRQLLDIAATIEQRLVS